MDQVVHFEIPADNMDRAEKFYCNVSDWKISKYPMSGIDYRGCHTVESDEKGMPTTLGAINGGLMERNSNAKTPIIAMKVKNIHETIEKIKASGGKLTMEPLAIGEMGLYAYFEDPEGNVLGIWQDKPEK